MATASGTVSSTLTTASSTLPDRQLSRVEGWTLLCDRLQAGDSATGLEGTLATAAGRAVDDARAARNGGDDAAASASELTVARACTLLDAMCARVDGATCAAFRIQQVHAARGSRLSSDALQALELNELGI